MIKIAIVDDEDVYKRQIQAIVNQKAAPAPAKKSNKEIAKEVLAGKWGNNPQRKAKLEAAGYNYATIQALVNKMC